MPFFRIFVFRAGFSAPGTADAHASDRSYDFDHVFPHLSGLFLVGVLIIAGLVSDSINGAIDAFRGARPSYR